MKKDIVIKSLADISDEAVEAAFLDAFADYDIRFSRQQIRDMLNRRGFNPALSAGAFSNGRLVSFIFNGIGFYNGVKCAYDTGTGTVREFRGMGLTDKIFTESLPMLRSAGVKRYVLEVLQSNAPAIKIYSRQGFEITRELNCYSGKIQRSSSYGPDGLTLVDASVEDIMPLAHICDFTPTWQNGMASLSRVPDALKCVVALIDNRPVGYGVTEPAYGDIAQIAVTPEMRRQGIGFRILSRLAEFSVMPAIKVINVDAGCDAFSKFIFSSGLSLSSTQYEMSRSLL